MAAGDVAPVNVELLRELRQRLRRPEEPGAQLARWRAYGVPHGRGPNLLAWNTDEVEPQTTLGWHLGERAPTTRASSASSTRRTSSPMRPCTSWQRSPTSASRIPYQLSPGAVRRRHRAARGAVHARPAVLGRRTFPDQITAFRGRRRHDRHDLAVPGQQPPGRRGAGRGDQARRRHDRAGRTRG